MSAMEPRTVTLHGRPVTYAQAGSGPVLLLIHGMGGTFENWQAVIEPLARHHTVVAPDLPGRSGTSARRSSGTRSAAESRCSSPTSSPR
jgi:pimeloyl-ACP methyl ester carboxylesterase